MKYTFSQWLFTSLQLSLNISQSISSISEHFNKLKLGFINFPKRISKVVKTFKHYFIFNNLHLFSPIAKSFQQFNFWFKQFCFLLFNNCKYFEHSTKQLNNLEIVIPAILKCIYLVSVITTMHCYHILYRVFQNKVHFDIAAKICN